MALRPARTASELAGWRHDPDGALVERAKAGDRAAFEELVRRHADRLHHLVQRLGLPADGADEVTQEAFLRAWRWIGAFKGQARFGTWLYRIGFNEANRRLRREPPRASVISLDDDGTFEPADVRDEPQVRIAQSELRAALATAVRGLPLKYRAPLILRDVEGLSTEDAAEIMGVSEAALKSRLHRARLAVRAALDDQPGDVV
jgi:RNA polymerase sigma-70 factor (ECF subfamily)